MPDLKVIDEQEFSKLIEFLNHQLRPQNSWSIADEYPIAFSKDNLSNLVVIGDEKAIYSHALIKELHVKTHTGLYKVAAIGSVVTNEKYRNQGYSSQVIHHCLDRARVRGCDFAILWSDLYAFYERFGFYPAGVENAFILDHPIEVEKMKLKILETPNVSASAISRLYQEHTVGSLRTDSEIRKFLKIPNSQIFTAWNDSNQLLSYAVVGKGADLIGYVHEWGGRVKPLLNLLNYIVQSKKDPITIISPHHCLQLNSILQSSAKSVHFGYLGLIKILNKDRILMKINRFLKARGLGAYEFISDGEQVSLTRMTSLQAEPYSFVFKNEKDLVKFLFGPYQEVFLERFPNWIGKDFKSIFPISMWIWGWDSV